MRGSAGRREPSRASPSSGPRDQVLVCSRRPAELLEQQAQRVEFGAETGPVPGLQPINSPIIVRERPPGSLIRRARRRRSADSRLRGNYFRALLSRKVFMPIAVSWCGAGLPGGRGLVNSAHPRLFGEFLNSAIDRLIVAEIEVECGRPDLARPLVEKGLALARKTAMGYWGPALLAYNAWLTEDASARAAYIAEAEELLAGKVVAHNHLWARRALMELGRTLGNPDLIEDQCAKLTSFYQRGAKPLSETIPFVAGGFETNGVNECVEVIDDALIKAVELRSALVGELASALTGERRPGSAERRHARKA